MAYDISDDTRAELSDYLAMVAPGRILECGSGPGSTPILARYARRAGASVSSLEHSPEYLSATATALHERRLDAYVDLLYAPLYQEPLFGLPWYGWKLDGVYDFILVDGPPEITSGRYAALYHLLPHLMHGGEIWLDDANRPIEQAALADWAEDLPISITYENTDRGLARIKRTPARGEGSYSN